jgi:hypothetical protein
MRSLNRLLLPAPVWPRDETRLGYKACSVAEIVDKDYMVSRRIFFHGIHESGATSIILEHSSLMSFTDDAKTGGIDVVHVQSLVLLCIRLWAEDIAKEFGDLNVSLLMRQNPKARSRHPVRELKHPAMITEYLLADVAVGALVTADLIVITELTGHKARR